MVKYLVTTAIQSRCGRSQTGAMKWPVMRRYLSENDSFSWWMELKHSFNLLIQFLA
jgi:hypothetical protein